MKTYILSLTSFPFFLMAFFALPFSAIGQTTLTCGDLFTDSGGPTGEYSENEAETFIICPDMPNTVVAVDFTSFSTASGGYYDSDEFWIFDGNSSSAPPILAEDGINEWEGSEGSDPVAASPFYSSHPSGCLTFVWHSIDDYVYGPTEGWLANITCVSPVLACNNPCDANYNPSATGNDPNACSGINICGCMNPNAINYNPTATIENVSCIYPPTPITTCDTLFVDSGGINGDYGYNEQDTTVFCPENPNEVIAVDFTLFTINFGGEMFIFNGNSTYAEPILTPRGNTDWDDGTYNSNQGNDPVAESPFYSTDSTGCLTFVWSSGGKIEQGWLANVSCVPPAGCTDPSVCNYDPNAVTDDGSCIYSFCDDVCSVYTLQIFLSTSPLSLYTLTNTNTGEILLSGSITSTSTVYNKNFYLCDFEDACYELNLDGFQHSWKLLDPMGNLVDQGGRGISHFSVGDNGVMGCTDPSACNYNPDAECEDGSCGYGYVACPQPCEAYKITMSSVSTSWDTWWDNEYVIFNHTLGDTIATGGLMTPGVHFGEDYICNMPDGCYTITVDGGQEVHNAISWKLYSNLDNPVSYNFDQSFYYTNTPIAYGIGQQTVYFTIGDISSSSCPSPCTAYSIEMNDEGGDGWNGASYAITDGTGNTVASGSLDDADWVTSANSGIDYICDLSDGCYNVSILGLGPDNEISWNLRSPSGEVLASTYSFISAFTIGSEIGGCTDPSACNYNPNATCNLGCSYGQIGCTNAEACNYNPAAGCDDGSCELPDCLGVCDGMETGSAIVGAPCDDGNLQTVNDVYDSNCNCVGTVPCDFIINPNGLYTNDCFLQINLFGEYCSTYPNSNLNSSSTDFGAEFSVVQLIQGNTYDLTVWLSCTYGDGNHQAWIDYNQNGEYESNETITNGSGSDSYSFTVLGDTPLGITTIRVSADDGNPNVCSGDDEISFLVNIIEDNPTACQLDCSCTGCMDICDTNFDPLANTHDQDLCSGMSLCGCTNPLSCNYDPNAIYDTECDPTPDIECEDPCNIFQVYTFNTSYYYEAGFAIVDPNTGYIIASGTSSQAICALPDGCYELLGNDAIDYFVNVYDADGNHLNPYGSSLFAIGSTCTDPNACNYNPDTGCPNNNTCTYETTCNSNVCIAPGITQWDETTCTCEIVEATVLGCTDPNACNFDDGANCDDNNCIYQTTCNTDICVGEGITQWNNNSCSCELVQASILGCLDPNACNFDANVDCNNNDCIYETSCNDDVCTAPGITQWDNSTCTCEIIEATVLGCTNPTASNYNPNANCEDGSCVNCGSVGTSCSDNNPWTFNDTYNSSCECVGETYCGTLNKNWGISSFPSGMGPVGSFQNPSMYGEFCSSYDATFTNFQDRVSELSVVQVMQGSTYELYSVYNCFAAPSCDFYISAWIVFNQDLIFDPSEKVLDFGPVPNFSGPFDIVIPADAPVGLTGMRLVMSNEPAEPCGLVDDIENWLINVNDPSDIDPCQLDCSCLGCTDVCDVNFDPLANVMDTDACAGEEIDYCTACLDPCDSNFEPTALYNDYSLCAGDDVCGCTDETACNYEPNALTEDYSCDYGQAACGDDCVYYLTLIGDYSYNPPPPPVSYSITNVATGQVFASGTVAVEAGNSPSAVVFFCDIPDGCYTLESSATQARLYTPDGVLLFNPYSFAIGEDNSTCNDPTACNYNPNATICVNNDACIYEATCNDPNACNYDPSSNCTNDDFCLYGLECDNEDCIFPGSPPSVCNLDYYTPCGEEDLIGYGYPSSPNFSAQTLQTLSFEGSNGNLLEFDYCEQNNYSALTSVPELSAGETYSITMDFDLCEDDEYYNYLYFYSYYNSSVGIWIDFNQNSFFEEGELIGSTLSQQIPFEFNFDFTVPIDAIQGLTGFRLIFIGDDYDSFEAITDGCIENYFWWNFVDLFVSIDETPSVGCIDPNACNYNPGSTNFTPCYYGEDFCETNDCNAIEGSCSACETFGFGFDPDDATISYTYTLTNLNTGEVVLVANSASVDNSVGFFDDGTYLCNFEEGCYSMVVTHSSPSSASWVTPSWSLFDPSGALIANAFDTDTTYFTYGDIGTFGCTDVNACNFDPEANCDDNSCIQGISGCMDPTACNYNPDACEESTCIYEIACEDFDPCTFGGVFVWNTESCACEITEPAADGCTDPTACNYDEAANCEDDSCLYGTDCPEEGFALAAKIMLEGPYLGGEIMNAGLGDLIPKTQPFNIFPYDYEGTELAPTIPTNAVDWVLVEMRSGVPSTTTQSTSITETRAALLLNNGNIVDIDGVSPVTFDNLNAEETYHICIRHRNHLDVLSANPVIANATMTYDFTTAENQAFGLGQLKEIEPNVFGLYAGDYTQEGIIQTTDYDLWFALPASLNVYAVTDGTLDGVVQNTDFDKWFANKAKLGVAEVRFD